MLEYVVYLLQQECYFILTFEGALLWELNIACSRLSVSGDDRKRGWATCGVWERKVTESLEQVKLNSNTIKKEIVSVDVL